MDNRLIVAFVAAAIIMVMYISYRKEGFTEGTTWIESILNSMSVMEAQLSARNVAADNVSAKNHLKGGILTVGSGTDNPARIEGSRFIYPTGTIDAHALNTHKMSVDGTPLVGGDIRKMKSLSVLAGYAIDGIGTTHLLFEGRWNLQDNFRWAANKWDDIIIFKGWKITLFENGDWTGRQENIENPTDGVLITKLEEKWGFQNAVNSYQVDWIGYI